ncbi:MAG: ECF transporter S component [Eubacteriales bacterium]
MKTKNATRKNIRPSEKTLSYVRRLTTDAMLIALFVVLNMFSLKPNNFINISFASFPIIICAVLYGPLDACIVAFGGSFLDQLIHYGFSPTMPLWMLPPVCRAAVLGIFTAVLFKKGKYMEKKPVLFYIMCIAGALVTSAVTTPVSYIDANLYGYFKPETFAVDTLARFNSSFVTSVILATVAIPVCMGLRRAKIGRRLNPSEKTEKDVISSGAMSETESI